MLAGVIYRTPEKNYLSVSLQDLVVRCSEMLKQHGLFYCTDWVHYSNGGRFFLRV